MHLRRPSAALLLVVSVLLAGLLGGCGGGGDQSGSGGSQGGDEEQQGEAQQGEAQQGEAQQGGGEQGQAAQGDPPEAKIALGRVVAVVPDRRKIILRPSAEVQGGERMIFKVKDEAEISLNDQPAEMDGVQEGQQAQIEYIVVNEQNRARRVELIAEGEGTGG
jgi:hypothetical protein